MTSRLGVDLAAQRRARADLAELARRQEGVDALRGALRRTGQLPGVANRNPAGGPPARAGDSGM